MLQPSSVLRPMRIMILLALQMNPPLQMDRIHPAENPAGRRMLFAGSNRDLDRVMDPCTTTKCCDRDFLMNGGEMESDEHVV